MADYRLITYHVRYWRGQIKRWSMSWEMTGSLTKPLDTTACQTLLLAADKLCYAGANTPGGSYQCTAYAKGGGVPLATYTRFAWNTPGSWIAYGGNATWSSTSLPFENAAEVAALIEWPAGLSKRGKPVTFKKFIHAVPSSSSAPGVADISAGVATALANQANTASVSLYAGYGIALGNASRLPGSPQTKTFYASHQMRRGRRKVTHAAAVAQNGIDQGIIKKILDSGGGSGLPQD